MHKGKRYLCSLQSEAATKQKAVRNARKYISAHGLAAGAAPECPDAVGRSWHREGSNSRNRSPRKIGRDQPQRTAFEFN